VTASVEFENMKEFRAVLRGLDPAGARLLGRAYKQAAQPVQRAAQAKVPNRVASRRNLDKGVRVSGSQTGGSVVIKSTPKRPTIAAVLGANVHPVFGRRYPRRVLGSGFPWRRHLGKSWRPEQLYGVGPVFENVAPQEIFDEFVRALGVELDAFLD